MGNGDRLHLIAPIRFAPVAAVLAAAAVEAGLEVTVLNSDKIDGYLEVSAW